MESLDSGRGRLFPVYFGLLLARRKTRALSACGEGRINLDVTWDGFVVVVVGGVTSPLFSFGVWSHFSPLASFSFKRNLQTRDEYTRHRCHSPFGLNSKRKSVS